MKTTSYCTEQSSFISSLLNANMQMKRFDSKGPFLIFLCRFLYPIYTLICVAAAAVIDSFPDFFHDKYSSDQSIFEKVSLKS